MNRHSASFAEVRDVPDRCLDRVRRDDAGGLKAPARRSSKRWP